MLTRLAIWWLRWRAPEPARTKGRLYWVWDERIEIEHDGDTVYRIEQIAQPVGGK